MIYLIPAFDRLGIDPVLASEDLMRINHTRLKRRKAFG